MGALKIDCYCDEQQMENILKRIVCHLNDASVNEVSDFDDMIGNVRVCIEFETHMDTVQIKFSEVLDSDWNILFEDSAVLTSRLKPLLKEHNRNHREAFAQAHHIIGDRRF
ncbi:hypothetical protein [Prevotella sp. 10(H)]|uniref:hypothetical protein n=1 Tax=Prevotella sp. 10(H) TaxID=1158294 RepID=UPI0004A6FDE1|nr:hypothetical protein [Prevotella sp. 10(H)]